MEIDKLKVHADICRHRPVSLRRVSYQSELPSEFVISSSLLFVFFADVGRVGDPKSKQHMPCDVDVRVLFVERSLADARCVAPLLCWAMGEKDGDRAQRAGWARHSGYRRSHGSCEVDEHGSRPLSSPSHELPTTVHKPQ